MNGTRWCSHIEYSGMSRTMTISSWSASKVTVRCAPGSSCSPAKISAYMRATRVGVSSRPSRSGSSPMAIEDLAHRPLDARRLVDRRLGVVGTRAASVPSVRQLGRALVSGVGGGSDGDRGGIAGAPAARRPAAVGCVVDAAPVPTSPKISGSSASSSVSCSMSASRERVERRRGAREDRAAPRRAPRR